MHIRPAEGEGLGDLPGPEADEEGALRRNGTPIIGWSYLSNAACLIRHRLFYECFVVSRIVIICQTICHF